MSAISVLGRSTPRRAIPDRSWASARLRLLAALALLLLVGDGPRAGADEAGDRYTFTRLEGPDKRRFLPLAINAKGQIVGELYPGDLPGGSIQAALREVDGRFTTIEPPGGKLATAMGINARGQIVGSAVDEKWSFGFVREPDGRYVRFTLDVPDPRPIPAAINDQGDILGAYLDKRRRPRDFLRRAEGRLRILPSYGSSFYRGLNSRGQVVGDFLDCTGTRHGLLLDEKDKVTLIDWPKTTLTQPKAINDQGVIVGIYLNLDPKFGLHRSFVRDPKGNLSALDFPGARETQATGINDAGHIVGRYEDHEGGHGFLAVPKGKP